MWIKTSVEQSKAKESIKIPVVPKKNNRIEYDNNHKGKKTGILWD